MLLLASIALTAGVLLATQRYGVRSVLPLGGLLCLVAVALFNATLGLAPLMGLIAGFQMERQRSYGQIVVAAALPGAALSLWLLMGQEALPRKELTELVERLEAMGIQAGEGEYSLRDAIGAVLRVRPAIEFVTLLLTVVLAYWASLWGGRRLQLSLPAALPFHLWRPWEELIWLLIAALALGLIGSGWIEDLALNLMVVMLVLYAVQGLAVVRFYVWRLGFSWLVELLLYAALVFISGLGVILLAGLGLLDTWFDWRRLRPDAPVPEKGER